MMSRLPPNQRLTTDFPFLHFGKIPEIDQLFKQILFSAYSDYSEKFKYSEYIVATKVIKMAKKDENKSCCAPADLGCCKVESVITVDDRGQMVLPKEIREKANIHAGDKLAVVSWEKDGEVCCISLIKVEKLEGMVKGMLGPVMKDILER
ncbi:MAG: HgcAB-associated protein [Candidatus Methanoperedens sp.]|nr:HgcAB-associated protein [Candidatus Methanoperedens sp.]CAG1008018.1 hypothetical protein METP1_03536 [Methanosarcinales archaeon]